MLKLSLTAVARDVVPVKGEIAPEDPLWEGMRVRLLEPVKIDAEARSVGKGVLVRGRVQTRVDHACRRCLVPVPTDVDDVVDLLYEPMEEAEEEDELAGEVYPLPPRGDLLDLGPALREELMLRVPEFVLCREDCRGLCPQCGTDLNQGTCECSAPAEPTAWEALKKIKFD